MERKSLGLTRVFHKHPNAKGVGLFLTKAVEGMGGTITVEYG
jgi:sensor histidine kinase regulating citrate/malate metabolism